MLIAGVNRGSPHKKEIYNREKFCIFFFFEMGEMGVNYSRLLIIGRGYYLRVNLEVGRDDNFLGIFLALWQF